MNNEDKAILKEGLIEINADHNPHLVQSIITGHENTKGWQQLGWFKQGCLTTTTELKDTHIQKAFFVEKEKVGYTKYFVELELGQHHPSNLDLSIEGFYPTRITTETTAGKGITVYFWQAQSLIKKTPSNPWQPLPLIMLEIHAIRQLHLPIDKQIGLILSQ